jgi:hypothetical protein
MIPRIASSNLYAHRFTKGAAMTYIEELRDVIHHLHGVDSRHLESVPIKETLNGKTIWDGTVEVFELIGHSNAPKAYAWAYETENPKKPRHVIVLHQFPLTSPLLAVRAAILEGAKNAES